MAEIKVKLSQTSQSFGGINISQTSQSIGTQISGTNTEIVPHDDTLKGSGSGSSPLGIADSVLQDIDNRVEKTNSADKVYGTDENGDQILYDLDSFGKVDDVLVDGQSVVVNKIAEIDLSGKVDANAPIQAATHTKIQYDNKGLVTGGSDLTESDIPSLHLSKISDITATASEVNVLDGITVSTSELNSVDGVSGNIQEQLNAKANSSDLASVATSGDYNDLSNTPTIGNGTLTVQKNNTTIDTFSANSTSNTTINIEVPTDTGDLTNGADYQTGTDVSGSISTHNESTTAHSNIITPINNNIGNIEEKIPSQASSSNQLADKAFVNSSIATNTANFIGTFNSVAELEAYSGTLTNNDYAFVIGTDTAGNTVYDRYKYTTSTTPASWVFEYELNNSSFTADQWAAINSGATTTNIGKAETAVQPSDLSTVATTGDYGDLLNKPTIPAAQVNSDWNANSGVAQILNKPTLATVATSGSYTDLSNKPTIPTVNNATLTIQKNGTTVNTFTANASSNVTANITVPTKTSDLTNDDGFITGITSGDVTTALGYTPVDPSSLATVATSGSYNDLLNKPTLATVAISGSYNDLSNKPTIPTVGDGTITIKQNGATLGYFTTNQGSNKNIDIGSDFDIFDTKWRDATTNNPRWLLSDGNWKTNTKGYQHLVDDIENKLFYRWDVSGTYYTAKRYPEVGDIVYSDAGVTQKGTVAYYNSSTDKLDIDTPLEVIDNAIFYGTASPEQETIAGITIEYIFADDGHKIVLADQESNVTAIYNATGVAWYYIIDTTNERFKLPRKQSEQIVENVQNNDGSWYRLYADGWVEQGGYYSGSGNNKEVTLLKTMTDTNYSIMLNCNGTAGAPYSGCSRATSTSKISISIPTAYSGGWWQVKGKSAINMSSFQANEKYLYFYVGA